MNTVTYIFCYPSSSINPHKSTLHCILHYLVMLLLLLVAMKKGDFTTFISGLNPKRGILTPLFKVVETKSSILKCNTDTMNVTQKCQVQNKMLFV